MPTTSRRSRMPLFRLLLAAAAAATPATARADGTLTAEQRTSLDKAVELWGMGVLGGGYGTPYTVTPDGDHFRLEVPLGRPIGHSGAHIEGDTLTASATALDGGRWALDNVQSPASIRLVPPPRPDGSAGDVISMAQQNSTRTSHVVIDPSLATISSFDNTAEGVVVGVALPKASFDFKADRTTSHAAWQPATGGRVDVSSTSAADGVTVQTPGNDGFRMTARRLSSEGHSAGFAPQRLADAVRDSLQILETTPASAYPGGTDPGSAGAAPGKPALAAMPHLDPAQRVLLHHMLDALRDAYGGLSQSVAMEGVDVAVQDHHVTMDRLAVSQAFATADAKADIRMRIAVDGIASPDVPPGTMRDFLPRHVVLAPHLSGIPVDDAFAMLSKAVDSEDPKLQDLMPDGMAALSRSPVTDGFDELSFDIGPAKLMASGSVRTSGPQDIVGSADVKVTGLDALIKRAGDDPLLQQGAPVLIFLKGIGQQDGDVVTWKVAFADHKLTVNGTDMSQMMPHGQ